LLFKTSFYIAFKFLNGHFGLREDTSKGSKGNFLMVRDDCGLGFVISDPSEFNVTTFLGDNRKASSLKGLYNLFA